MKLFTFLFSPKGRIHRFPFIYTWMLVSLIVSMVSVFAVNSYILWFAPIFLLPLTIKRLHDVNITGFYSVIIYQIYALWVMYLLGLTSIEFVSYQISMETLIYFMLWPSALCVFYLMIKRGYAGTNKYGIDPTWKIHPRVPLQEFLSWSNEKSAEES